MSATLIASNTFGFADGSGGHSCNLGSAPNVGELDILCVSSNTVVSTPAGFTAAPTAVNRQGAYIFRRIAAGGEGSTVTVTTSGDHDTQVSWSRWGNIISADDAHDTMADGSSGTSTPAHSTAVLAATGELVIAFAALHDLAIPAPTSPSWSAGYTALSTAMQGTDGTGVIGFVGYKLNAGTAAESPSVSWTNAANDRYMLTLTFTTVTSADVVGSDSGTLAESAVVAVAISTSDTAAVADSSALTAAIDAADDLMFGDSGTGTGDPSAKPSGPRGVSVSRSILATSQTTWRRAQ